MLRPEQRAEFETLGTTRLRGAFSKAAAAEMETAVWDFLGRRFGALRSDPTTWDVPLASGLQPLRTHPSFAAIGGPALRGALDDLLGTGRWQEPRHWGQMLVSFPTPAAAGPSARAGWHTDFPYSLPPDRTVGVLVLVFINRVAAGAGGTFVLSGSPRVVSAYLDRRPHLRSAKMKVTRCALLDSDPWLRAITGDFDAAAWARGLDAAPHELDGVPVAVTELTGEPGDIVLAHPWLLHTPSPNRGETPRFMRVQRIAAKRRPRPRAR